MFFIVLEEKLLVERHLCSMRPTWAFIQIILYDLNATGGHSQGKLA